MGASVRPENPFDAIRVEPPNPFDNIVVETAGELDPRPSAAAAQPQPPAKPGIGSQLKAAGRDVLDAVRHPVRTLKEAGKAAIADAEKVGTAIAAGSGELPYDDPRVREANVGLGKAAVNTGVNLATPAMGLARRVGLNAAMGAYNAPEGERVRGAAGGVILGEAIAAPVTAGRMVRRVGPAIRRATDVSEGAIDARGVDTAPELAASPAADAAALQAARVAEGRRVGIRRRPREATPEHPEGFSAGQEDPMKRPGSRRLEALERGIRRRPRDQQAVTPEQAASQAAALPEDVTAIPPRAPLPGEAFPEGFSAGRDPKEPGRVPRVIGQRGPAIKGESAPGMYLDERTRPVFEAEGTPRAPATEAPPAPERVIDADAEEAAALKAERAAERAERDALPKVDYRALDQDGLLDELLTEYKRIDDEQAKMQGDWVRDQGDGTVVSGGRFGDGAAKQQTKFALERIRKIERELTKKYELDDDGIAGALAAHRERRAMAEAEQMPTDAVDDFDFSFGDEDVTPPVVADSPVPTVGNAPAAPRAPATPEDALVNVRKFGLTGDAEEILRRQIREAAPAKEVVTFASRRPAIEELKTRLNLDPSQLDPQLAKKLDANALYARMDRVSENVTLIETLSREAMADGLAPDQTSRLLGAIDQLEAENKAFLEQVMTGRSEKGRELGALRMLAQRSTDPAVWELRAMRSMGNRPLPDHVRAEVRRLARVAAEVCRA